MSFTFRLLSCFAICVLLSGFVSSHVHAQIGVGNSQTEKHAEAHTNSYRIHDAFLRATPGDVSAAYATIQNPTGNDDVLVGASADWAGRIELHETSTDEDGVMHMRKVDEMTLPAKGKLVLQPGGKHLMIFGVKDKLQSGQSRVMTFVFRNAGSIRADVAVKPITHKGAPPQHAHH